MKKKIIVLALCVLMISGCGSKIPKLSNGDEAVVTLKNGSMISVDELYNKVKEDYALEAMLSLVDKRILEDKYKDKMDEAKKYAENTMATLEQYYGENLEQAIKENTGLATKEAYQDSVYVGYLQNLAFEDYGKSKVTDKEIKKYYKDKVVGDIKVSHILITPNVKDSMTDSEKKDAEKEAKEKVEKIINQLKKTKQADLEDKFIELAKANSQDDTTKDNGGSLGFINKDTLSPEYNELVKAAYELKDGEFSTKVITTELGYHVVLRKESKEKATLDEVKDDIKSKLGEQYLQKNPAASVKALQELREAYGLKIEDSELQKQYAAYIQGLLNRAQQMLEQQNQQQNQEQNK